VAAVYLGDRMTPAVAQAGAAGGQRGGARGGPAPAYSPGSLPPYAGEYRSEELQATYRVVLRDGSLLMERRGAAATRLVATAADAFRAGTLELRFLRDAANSIVGFTVQAGRVQNLRFDRVR
jgi:hypothetical protein